MGQIRDISGQIWLISLLCPNLTIKFRADLKLGSKWPNLTKIDPSVLMGKISGTPLVKDNIITTIPLYVDRDDDVGNTWEFGTFRF